MCSPLELLLKELQDCFLSFQHALNIEIYATRIKKKFGLNIVIKL